MLQTDLNNASPRYCSSSRASLRSSVGSLSSLRGSSDSINMMIDHRRGRDSEGSKRQSITSTLLNTIESALHMKIDDDADKLARRDSVDSNSSTRIHSNDSNTSEDYYAIRLRNLDRKSMGWDESKSVARYSQSSFCRGDTEEDFTPMPSDEEAELRDSEPEELDHNEISVPANMWQDGHKSLAPVSTDNSLRLRLLCIWPLPATFNLTSLLLTISIFQDHDKADRQSWASFDIRTAQPDEPIVGLLDKVAVEVMDSVNANKVQCCYYSDSSRDNEDPCRGWSRGRRPCSASTQTRTRATL